MEGLLSTGPTPSSFFKNAHKKISSVLHLLLKFLSKVHLIERLETIVEVGVAGNFMQLMLIHTDPWHTNLQIFV